MKGDPTLDGMDLEEHLRDPAIRQRFVTTMFEVIAPRYDRFTRVFSFGMDAAWKRAMLADLAAIAPPGATILDLACGTGDLAFAAAETVPGARVIGLDASPRMIDVAMSRARRASERPVSFIVGDMMRLPVEDASADVVMVGYGLRNVPQPSGALAEIARVLRPGGRLLVLDFYRPEHPLWRATFLSYLRIAGNVIGWLWHRSPATYGYIAPSIGRYVTAGEFGTMLRQAGLRVERESTKLGGGIGLHRAVEIGERARERRSDRCSVAGGR
ncbi:MAG TPA: ubiquinone/menaquinone biosynthesis methyltransferase [Gemmatimonadaceae bacterium]|nr:ubiquinone/menaquinone biosynthesis methyltransferase [Gemmatimonadaceae bacterium]